MVKAEKKENGKYEIKYNEDKLFDMYVNDESEVKALMDAKNKMGELGIAFVERAILIELLLQTSKTVTQDMGTCFTWEYCFNTIRGNKVTIIIPLI